MSLIKSTFPKFPKAMDELLNPYRFFEDSSNWWPATNIKEDENNYQVELAVPGYKKEDFNIEAENGVVTIMAQRKIEDEQKEENYTRKEFSYQSFRKSFTLPEGIKEDDIKAKYKDGILNLEIAKSENHKRIEPKKIAIS